MPQMMPMMWLFTMMFLTTLLFTTMIMIYFLSPPFIYPISTPYKKSNWIWKW